MVTRPQKKLIIYEKIYPDIPSLFLYQRNRLPGKEFLIRYKKDNEESPHLSFVAATRSLHFQ
jgi:hypothetical protein